MFSWKIIIREKYRDVIQKLANSVAIKVTVDSVYNSGGFANDRLLLSRNRPE